jgi:hypothetical protein
MAIILAVVVVVDILEAVLVVAMMDVEVGLEAVVLDFTPSQTVT